MVISGLAALFGLNGALGSHRALRWQRRRDEERRAVRVRLEVEHSVASRDWGTPNAGSRPDRYGYALEVSAVNASEVAVVYIRHLEIVEANLTESLYLAFESHTRLEPGQRLTVRELADTGMSWPDGFVIRAELESGQIFTDGPHLWREECIAMAPEAVDQGRDGWIAPPRPGPPDSVPT